MTTAQIAVRLTKEDLSVLDEEVSSGRAANRSAAVRKQIAKLRRRQVAERDLAVLAAAKAAGEEIYPEFTGLFENFNYPEID